MMRQTKRKLDAVNLLERFEERRLLQRPELCQRSSRARRQKQAIHGAPRGFISRFHAGNIRIRAHVIGSHKQISQLHLGLRPVLKRTCSVD